VSGSRPVRAGGPLVRIELQCPKCGAPFEVDDETRSVVCEHCGSLLLLEAPEREELYLAEGLVHGPQDLVEILVGYRVQAHRAEVVHRFKDSNDNPPPELLIENRLAAYERTLRETVRLLAAEQVHVPYWHLTGAIVQGILGRIRGAIKTTRVRAFAVEHTVPGYAPERANLRDRGLRLDHTLARPLTAAAVSGASCFLPRVPMAERQFREIDRWLRRDLDREAEPIARHAAFLPGPRLLIYRPYWIAKLITDQGQEWVLFDGSFETIAGYPSEREALALPSLRDADPLGTAQESFRRVRVIPSRCPDCGVEGRYDREAALIVCSSCHLALQLTPEGARVVPYDHAVRGGTGADTAYLPFWRFAFQAEFLDRTLATSIEEYGKVLFPQPPPGFRLEGRHLYVPAFRLLGTEPGDEAFKAICEWIHAQPPEVREGKIPLDGQPRLVGASLTSDDARALAPFVLVALHTKTSAARMSALLFKRAVQDVRMSLTEPRLLMLPFDCEGDEVTIPEARLRISAQLLRRGPEIQHLRATVFRAAASEPR
jgi:DNA-directed RNA polymerase subunit RPC12/RpoP